VFLLIREVGFVSFGDFQSNGIWGLRYGEENFRDYLGKLRILSVIGKFWGEMLKMLRHLHKFSVAKLPISCSEIIIVKKIEKK